MTNATVTVLRNGTWILDSDGNKIATIIDMETVENELWFALKYRNGSVTWYGKSLLDSEYRNKHIKFYNPTNLTN